MIKVIILFVLIFNSFLTSAEDKSFLSGLNGKNHVSNSPNSLNNIPLDSEKMNKTLIKGIVIVRGQLGLPVRKGIISLFLSENKIDEVNINHDGTFTFSGKFKDGVYKLLVKTHRYSGIKEINLNGYALENLLVEVDKIAN